MNKTRRKAPDQNANRRSSSEQIFRKENHPVRKRPRESVDSLSQGEAVGRELARKFGQKLK